MRKGFLVFTIYTLFYHYLLFVGAKFQQPNIADASASSTPDSTPSPGTPIVVPTTQPTQTTNPSITQNIKTIQTRRISSIIEALTSPGSISSWLSTLGSDGKWPDNEVDYTTGCAARRANWPAQTHWRRILVMAGAWHGGLHGADQYVKSQPLRTAISSAMDYWFDRDFTNLACLDFGGTDQCPCTNTTLWNTNWFSNIILIPGFVGQTCLLLNDTLSPAQLDKCMQMTGRAYGTFGRIINGLGLLTGANTLDVAKIGIDLALLTSNISLITDAYRRVHSDLQIGDEIKADGIRADGSFGQHGGILYNGNYGKNYAMDVLDLEIDAVGTTFAAESGSQNAFTTLFEGNRWMIFRNTLTEVLHWDFSVLGRFISFPVIDSQATGDIDTNLTQVLSLGKQWSSDTLIEFANSLSKNTAHANAGNLIGNRMFYANDYMVNRGPNYVSTLKMYSSRTENTECANSQNPKGFHLSDGVLYTYLRGNEYEDIAAAWDWNLIPGITVDYGATPLTCSTTQQNGSEAFVGGVSDGRIGIAAMRYTNPLTGSLRWQKAWFFLEGDVQHTMISGLNSTTSAPVYSVLDQRLHTGPVIVDGVQTNLTENAEVRTLWHGSVGYLFPNFNNSAVISVAVGEKTGPWSAIGISTQPPPTVDLFTARIEHKSISAPMSYSTFPGTSYDTFLAKSRRLCIQSVQNDSISALFDEKNKVVMVVFWAAAGGSVTFNPASAYKSITITADGNIALLYRLETGKITVSDPSQSLTKTRVRVTLVKPLQKEAECEKTLIFDLPSGGVAGSSVCQTVG